MAEPTTVLGDTTPRYRQRRPLPLTLSPLGSRKRSLTTEAGSKGHSPPLTRRPQRSSFFEPAGDEFQRLVSSKLSGDSQVEAPNGSIDFQARKPDCPLAKFCVISTRAEAQDVSRLLQLWIPEKPLVMLSITGGAQTLDLDMRLEEVLLTGLAKAASSAKAWLIDGGTDSGVMYLAGQAFKNLPGGQTPLIGIVPYRKITHHEAFKAPAGSGPISYVKRVANSTASTAIDPLHTHFLLVDASIEGKAPSFGEEIEMRSKVEDQLRKDLQTAALLLVVGGGPGTYKTVWTQVRFARTHGRTHA